MLLVESVKIPSRLVRVAAVKIQSTLWIVVVPVLVDPIEAISKVFLRSYLEILPGMGDRLSFCSPD